MWSNGDTTEMISNLSPGTYTVIVTDSAGCTITDEIMINEPDEIQITIDNIIEVSSPGAGDGGRHRDEGDGSDVANMRANLQDLYDAVAEQVAAGKTLEETIEAVTLEQYSDWGQYEAWLPLNIEGMYTRVPR